MPVISGNKALETHFTKKAPDIAGHGRHTVRGSYNTPQPCRRPSRCSMSDTPSEPTEDRRREMFAALVDAQDRGLSVHQSRQDVAAMFGVTWNTVVQIEREGMDNDWPPL
jgi:hypothetical protein